MVGVEPAWIWQDPEAGAAQPFRLRAGYRSRPFECDAVRTDADNRDPAWSVSADFLRQSSPAKDELLGGQLGGRGRRARHQVGDSISPLEENVLLPWCEKSLRVSGSE
jgi:hypothetical protein